MTTTITRITDRLADAGAKLRAELANANDTSLGYGTPRPMGDLSAAINVSDISGLIAWRMLEPSLRDHTLCFLGPSAIGKTEAIRQGFQQACDEMGREGILHEEHVSQMGPTDVMGVPRDDGQGRTVWFPPRKYPLVSANKDHEKDWQAFLRTYQTTGEAPWTYMKHHPQYGMFFDEVTNPSNPSILHQCFSIWHGKFIADHRLVSDTFIVLAGNRVQDRTNSIPFAASATSRLDLIEVVPSLSGWLQNWAMTPYTIMGEELTREHPLVIAFLQKHPDLFAPDTSGAPQMEPFPAPRNWSYVSQMLYANEWRTLPDNILFTAVAGRIGLTAARAFWTFRAYADDVPDMRKMLNSTWMPEEWPTRPDILYIMVTQMVTFLNQHNASRFLELVGDSSRFTREYKAVALKLLRPSGKLDALIDEWAPDAYLDFAQDAVNVLLNDSIAY